MSQKVYVEDALQAYFQLMQKIWVNSRELILVDEGASVHYIEGCSAPVYTADALHSVVEIVVKASGTCRYTTIKPGQMMFIT